jgi:hypothetical protein
VEEAQHGEARAPYGTRQIKTLAEQLMPKYGKTFSNEISILSPILSVFQRFGDCEHCVHNLTLVALRSI